MRIEEKRTSDNVKYFLVINDNDEVLDDFSNYDDAYAFFNEQLKKQYIEENDALDDCKGIDPVDLEDYEF